VLRGAALHATQQSQTLDLEYHYFYKETRTGTDNGKNRFISDCVRAPPWGTSQTKLCPPKIKLIRLTEV